jgi:hypothetical protein
MDGRIDCEFLMGILWLSLTLGWVEGFVIFFF